MSEDFKFKPEELVDAESIKRILKEKLEADIANTIQWKVQDIVKAHAIEILTPELKLIVEAQKEQILQGVRDGLPGIAKAIAESMVAKSIKNLAGYGSGDIFKKLFD